MDTLRELSRFLHVILGFGGLIAFWIPAVARKGGSLHRKAGKVFAFCAYGVFATSWLSCLIVFYKLQGMAEVDRRVLALIVFLFYLANVTFAMLHHGLAVLRSKNDVRKARSPFSLVLAWGSAASSAGLLLFAVLYDNPMTMVLFALSPIGFGVAWDIFQYRRHAAEKRVWFYEHLKATLGAGIAFHTAFFVFGNQRMLDLSAYGWIGLLPWILPALIGVPATKIWENRYRRRFGDLPSKRGAEAPSGSLGRAA